MASKATLVVMGVALIFAATDALVHSGRVVPTAAASNLPVVKPPSKSVDTRWDLGKVAFSLLPLAPGDRRKTIETCVVKDQVWTHDQLQGIVNVNVPVRQTVIRLESGGLFVHNPVAPTPELVSMMKKLEAEHGPVKFVVLGTTGLEHKALAGPFSQQFPKAEVWLQEGQYSFPVPTPNRLYGFKGKINKIPKDSSNAPWVDEIDHVTLGPLKFKSVGTFGETAFFHKRSRTLLVTDTVVKLESEPPAIVQEDPRALLFHARDDATMEVEDGKVTREVGWRRMALFGLVFFPSAIDVDNFAEAVAKTFQVPRSMSRLGDGAVPFKLYPWTWARDDSQSFEALQSSGGNAAGLFVAPILQKLILDREPEQVLEWVDQVCQFNFQRVIPCHLANDVKASPRDFHAAFSFLRPTPSSGATMLFKALPVLPFFPSSSASAKKEDLALLQTASDLLTDLGVVAPSAVKNEDHREGVEDKLQTATPSLLRTIGRGWL